MTDNSPGLFVLFRISKQLLLNTRNAVLERFIAEAIEANQCQFGGGGANEFWSGFVEPEDPNHPLTNATRYAILCWLSNEPLVIEYFVSDLFDLNDGKLAEYYLTLRKKTSKPGFVWPTNEQRE
jgi:uncharacterized protein YggL (DUF469 family)